MGKYTREQYLAAAAQIIRERCPDEWHAQKNEIDRLRNRRAQAERQRDEARWLLEESQRIGVIAPLSWRRRVDAHLSDTGE